MNFSIKMYLIIFIGAFIVLYQYHLSNAWLISHSHVSISTDQNPLDTGDKVLISPSTTDNTKPTTQSTNSSAIINVTVDRLASSKSLPKTRQLLLQVESVLPTLYIITPTYRRPEQIPELTRMAHTLMLVPNLRWLLIEDAHEKSPLVADLLQRTGLQYEHLVAPMPDIYKNRKGAKPRGVSNRNRGLEWLRANATSGVFYFADDDNAYDLQIFEEMRYTKRVSMWPVGLITKLGISTPVVRDGKFAGFYDGWVAGRMWPVDMAGFAVSVPFLKERPKAFMPFKPGYEEDGFLKSLAPFEPREIELLASNCTKVFTWHTQTKKNEPSKPLDTIKYNNTNLVLLKQIIV